MRKGGTRPHTRTAPFLEAPPYWRTGVSNWFLQIGLGSVALELWGEKEKMGKRKQAPVVGACIG